MSRSKIIILILLLSITFLSASLFAQDKASIAVLPLQGNGVSPSEASVLTDELRSVIVQLEKYIVLERNNMESILTEQGFQLRGCTSAECAVEAGKLLGVNKMVAGSVGKLGELFNINIRLFDIGTGRIEKNVSQKHEGSIEELLDVINKLAYDLSATGTSTSLEDKRAMDQSDKTPIGLQSDTYQSNNRIGLWLGLNFPSTSKLSNAGNGFGAGVLYKVHIVSNIFIQPELSYTTREIEYDGPDDIFQFDYIHVAALLSYEITSSNIKDFFLILNAGPAINSVLSAKEDYDGDVWDIKSLVENKGFSILLGIGLGIRFGKIIVTIETRYESGLSTIFKDDIEWEVGKNQAFSLLAGIAL